MAGASTTIKKPYRKGQNEDEESYFNRYVEIEYETIYRSCDKKSNLFILQQKLFIQGTSVPSQGETNCMRYLKKIISFVFNQTGNVLLHCNLGHITSNAYRIQIYYSLSFELATQWTIVT